MSEAGTNRGAGPGAGLHRRSFLKTGALAAAPVAVLVPGAALADDGAHGRLARLEDERAIEGVHRAFLRRFKGGSAKDCASLLARADAVRLEAGVCAIADDPGREGSLRIAPDGASALLERPCRVELERRFEGHTTLERMARFQGHGHHRHAEERLLVGRYVRTGDGWAIAGLHLV